MFRTTSKYVKWHNYCYSSQKCPFASWIHQIFSSYWFRLKLTRNADNFQLILKRCQNQWLVIFVKDPSSYDVAAFSLLDTPCPQFFCFLLPPCQYEI